MVSAIALSKLFDNMDINLIDFDTDATTAGANGPAVDMRDYRHFAVLAKPSVLGGAGITRLKIIASATSNLASPEIIKDSGAVVANAIDDVVALECDMTELAQAGATAGKALRYVGALVIHDNATDESVLCYVRCGARFNTPGQTATVIT